MIKLQLYVLLSTYSKIQVDKVMSWFCVSRIFYPDNVTKMYWYQLW